eukprot:TRINITY_DN3200_c0_g2_i1.p1 TRINITY_DN3200_c0_g2~~TRINITY_DN3200_c0_g2_i1.p1  ORF type:complete len:109 (-),score=5.08 TRINITY_DN3200_c0_g2_i1:60-386(-)
MPVWSRMTSWSDHVQKRGGRCNFRTYSVAAQSHTTNIAENMMHSGRNVFAKRGMALTTREKCFLSRAQYGEKCAASDGKVSALLTTRRKTSNIQFLQRSSSSSPMATF